ncbi:membrane protein insertase YidC [Flavobacterium selenitireducens]|uniref:membrane protein insertase YidC n=1 Tax=Flavobacterium selenitireducens TaxID=2722704 RepID=UPI00168C0712|nr:membrane protein insertase YidC [Flavobacterium selenitireducens]MBD3583613.1 membrane protein insertase YidC [Flavobacterium selenitireducens]
MEKKKFDLSSMIGFVLIFGILMWIMYQNQPSEAEIAAEKAKKEQIEKAKTANAAKVAKTEQIAADTTATDSSKIAALKGTLGSFAYSATLPSAKETSTTLENDLIKLVISNKGGFIKEAVLKDFERFHKGSGELVQLINNNNASLNLQLHTSDNRVLDTKNLYFEPTVTKIGDSQVLTLRLKSGPEQFLEYRYVLKPNDYMLDFDIRTQGLAKVLNTSKPIDLNWDMKAFRNEKSVSYENRYAEIVYEYEDGKDDYLAQGTDEKETVEEVTYTAFKQHFFTSILLTKTPFKTVDLESKNLVDDEKVDTVYTKQFAMKAPLAFNSAGELDYKMNWYYGPADYKLLSAYDRNLDEIIPLGWGIFGWINKGIFVPLFGFLGSFIAYGLAIILFTLLIKLAMSPITYRSFLSQAKMRVLRPEITELNEKFSKDPMKRQQETMALYNKAGVNPLAGCIPALIQLPFVYASFQFFPSAIELRQKSFLWADDLSSFDEIARLPFTIPVYGNHVSLFPILAAIAIFFYMKMTSGDQAMAQPPQEGMPDMSKVMKIMIYLSPLMMLLFFNNYGSGLSLYNFISNLVTIAIMFVIKKYVVDEQKIHLQIQENKKKPKTQGKFQKRMQELMEQAEAQKAQQNKKK